MRGGIMPFFKRLIFSVCLIGLFFQLHSLEAKANQEPARDLQLLIDAAEPGETINLQPITYSGPITIDKPLSLIGQKETVVDGEGLGTVITVTANDVVIEGITTRNSGKSKSDYGLLLKDNKGNYVRNNIFSDVFGGIFIENGTNHLIEQNQITSYKGHFSKRGNGIHLLKGEGHQISYNEIIAVQDGIYFDFTKNITVTDNSIKDSRYALHYMFSKDMSARNNVIKGNITGIMVMGSENLLIENNAITDQLHVRGCGILLYDSNTISLNKNNIKRNSIGLSLEESTHAQIHNNIIAANQIGLEFKGENKKSLFSENNFLANIVSSKITQGELRLDDGEKGNYWDDYTSYDVTGDGIGEVAYQAGSLYDRLLQQQPYWQFFFESPAVKLWSKAEAMLPSFAELKVYDSRPLVEPVKWGKESKSATNRSKQPLILGVLFLAIASLIMIKGRRF